MENGLDLSVTQKHYNWYIKLGKRSQAGALMAVLTAAHQAQHLVDIARRIITTHHVTISEVFSQLRTLHQPLSHIGVPTVLAREPTWSNGRGL
eukprot:5879599-Karenia_brevis.AAC.1